MGKSDAAEQRTTHEGKLHLLEAVIPGVAHEITNCNQTILLSGQVLLDVVDVMKRITDRYYAERGDFSVGGVKYSTLKDDLKSYLVNIIQSAQRIEKIISEMRAFTRAVPEAQFQSTNLNRLIESAAILLANTIRKSTNRFTMELAAVLPDVRGHPQWILQAIVTLILNACHVLHDRKQSLHVSTRYDDEEKMVLCELKYETGGTSPETSAWTLQVGASPRTAPVESAEGLTLIARIAARHGGAFDLQSEPGKGTRAVFRLPVEQPAE